MVQKPKTAGTDQTSEKQMGGLFTRVREEEENQDIDRYRLAGKRGPIKPNHKISTSIAEVNRTANRSDALQKKNLFQISTASGAGRPQANRSASNRTVFSADKSTEDGTRRNLVSSQTPAAKATFSLASVGGPNNPSEKPKRRPSKNT